REYVAEFFGVMRAGLVAVPFSYKLAQPVIDHIARDSALQLLFHDAANAAKLPEGVAAVALDGAGYQALLDHGPLELVAPAPREVGMILYTSGSIGLPKGVLLT